MLVFGFVVASLAFFGYSHMSLQSGTWDILLHQINQGAGMAFVFVPLTVLTMDPIPKAETGYATSLYSVMRNIGSSVGISFVTTWVARRSQFHQSILAAHVTRYDLRSQQFLGLARGLFFHQGFDWSTAGHRGLGGPLRYAPAAGGLAQLCRSVPDYGFPVFGHRSLGAAHEEGNIPHVRLRRLIERPVRPHCLNRFTRPQMKDSETSGSLVVAPLRVPRSNHSVPRGCILVPEPKSPQAMEVPFHEGSLGMRARSYLSRACSESRWRFEAGVPLGIDHRQPVHAHYHSEQRQSIAGAPSACWASTWFWRRRRADRHGSG